MLSKNDSPQSLAIVGWHEGAAGVVHSWIENLGIYKVCCFINPSDEPVTIVDAPVREATQFSYPTNNSFKELPLYNLKHWGSFLKDNGTSHVLITTTDPRERLNQIKQAKNEGLELINAIHPSALVMEDVLLAENIIVHARAVVGYRSEISSGAIVNTGAQLDHHCVVKEGATISPGVVLAGNVTVEKMATIYTGAVIKNNVRIGQFSTVGAGAVVISDVADHSCVVGIPAKPINGVKDAETKP